MRGRARFFSMVCGIVLAFSFADTFATGKEPINATDKKIAENYKRDNLRDKGLPFKAQRTTENRERFTSKEKAAKETKEGLPAGTHLGAKVKPGRPLSQGKASAQYGIAEKDAEVRSVWRVEKGTPTKSTKVIGGHPGKGEVTTGVRIPPKERVSGPPADRHK